MEVQQSKDAWLVRRRIMLMGPPKSGKTVLAATMSDFCPAELPNKGPIIDLKDLLFAQMDVNGMESLRAMGLSAPFVDMSKCNTMKEFREHHKEFMQIARDRVSKGITKTVVFDPLSTLDAILVGEAHKLFPDAKNSGTKWSDVQQKHMDFAKDILRELDCNVVVTCHSKSNMNLIGDETAAAADSKKAGMMPGQATIVPAISRGAVKFYLAQTGALWALVCEKDKKGTETRYILPNGGDGYEGGSRYRGLAEREPANLKLVFEKLSKVEAAREAERGETK